MRRRNEVGSSADQGAQGIEVEKRGRGRQHLQSQGEAVHRVSELCGVPVGEVHQGSKRFEATVQEGACRVGGQGE